VRHRMEIFATLGPIEFQILTSPTRFDAERTYTYAKHDVVEGRPRLQWLSQDLEQLELRVRWHVAFTNPQAQFDALVAAAEAHTAMPLVFGNGLLRGFYVIETVRERVGHAADDGSLILIECDICLREYAFDPTLEETTAAPGPTPGIAGATPQPGQTAITSDPPDPRDSGGSFANMSFDQVPAEMVVRSPKVGGAGGNW